MSSTSKAKRSKVKLAGSTQVVVNRDERLIEKKKEVFKLFCEGMHEVVQNRVKPFWFGS